MKPSQPIQRLFLYILGGLVVYYLIVSGVRMAAPEWLLENKKWLKMGVGVLILAVAFRAYWVSNRKRKLKDDPKSDSSSPHARK